MLWPGYGGVTLPADVDGRCRCGRYRYWLRLVVLRLFTTFILLRLRYHVYPVTQSRVAIAVYDLIPTLNQPTYVEI